MPALARWAAICAPIVPAPSTVAVMEWVGRRRLTGRQGRPSRGAPDEKGFWPVLLAALIVDHAHPEYSGPECLSPYDAVLWDKAGEQIVYDAARFAGAPDIALYKNNTDNKGASYGSHENYLMSRRTAFADIVRHLTPFFVSRQVVCGA